MLRSYSLHGFSAPKGGALLPGYRPSVSAVAKRPPLTDKQNQCVIASAARFLDEQAIALVLRDAPVRAAVVPNVERIANLLPAVGHTVTLGRRPASGITRLRVKSPR